MKKNELIQMHQLLMEVYKFVTAGEVGDVDLDNAFMDTYNSQNDIKPTSVNKKLSEHNKMVRVLGFGLSSGLEDRDAKDVMTDPDSELRPYTNEDEENDELAEMVLEQIQTDPNTTTTETTEDEEDAPDPRTDTDAKIENVTQDDVPDELLQKLRDNNMAI